MLTAIIVAAGASRRMGFDKLFADLEGKPIVAHSVAAFEACGAVNEIVVVAREECAPLFHDLAAREGWRKLRQVVPGGAERHLSVWNGLEAASAVGEGDFIAVHDGARPLVTPAMIERCLARAREVGAACCAAPVSDTLKRADAAGCVAGGVDRTGMWAMHTPQIFAATALVRAYRAVLARGSVVTDEASALEAIGLPVALVDSADYNLKITYPADLQLAGTILHHRRGFFTHVNEKH